MLTASFQIKVLFVFAVKPHSPPPPLHIHPAVNLSSLEVRGGEPTPYLTLRTAIAVCLPVSALSIPHTFSFGRHRQRSLPHLSPLPRQRCSELLRTACSRHPFSAPRSVGVWPLPVIVMQMKKRKRAGRKCVSWVQRQLRRRQKQQRCSLLKRIVKPPVD